MKIRHVSRSDFSLKWRCRAETSSWCSPCALPGDDKWRGHDLYSPSPPQCSSLSRRLQLSALNWSSSRRSSGRFCSDFLPYVCSDFCVKLFGSAVRVTLCWIGTYRREFPVSLLTRHTRVSLLKVQRSVFTPPMWTGVQTLETPSINVNHHLTLISFIH